MSYLLDTNIIIFILKEPALANDLTLLTHNSDEFLRVPGLRIEDWVRTGA